MRNRFLHSGRLWGAIVLAMVATAVWIVTGYRLSEAQGFTGISNGPGFITSNRDHLRICVESLDPSVTSDELKQYTAKALDQVKSHPDFVAAGLAQGTPQIDIGCPGPARAMGEGFSWETGGNGDGATPWVSEPGPYLTYVFVVPSDKVASPASLLRVVPQEYYADGQDRAVVTAAVYLTPDDLQAPGSVVRYLTRGVGLRQVNQ